MEHAEAHGILENIAAGTDSSLILFFVIVAVVIVAVVAPLYALILKDRKHTRQHDTEKHKSYLEREREIIGVIRDNSAVIAENVAVTAGLKVLLANNSADTKEGIKRIHERMDVLLTDTAATKATTKAILSAIQAGGVCGA